MARAILLATLAVSNAYAYRRLFDVYDSTPHTFELWYDTYAAPMRGLPSPASSYWTSSLAGDAYQLKMKLPDMEPASVSAELASDGKSIQVVGERKIEGCTCRPSTVQDIPLPYRPRADDIHVTVKDDVLSIKLARQAKAEDAPTPLKVNVLEAQDSKAAPKEEQETAQATGNTRPLRFVPHESTRPMETKTPSLQDKERTLAAKFRSAALATLASSRSTGGDNAIDATTAAARGDHFHTAASPSLNESADPTGSMQAKHEQEAVAEQGASTPSAPA